MHSDLHTDLDNLDSLENNLRHSAKGSNDAYNVTFSLTGYEPPRVSSPVDLQFPVSDKIEMSGIQIAIEAINTTTISRQRR